MNQDSVSHRLYRIRSKSSPTNLKGQFWCAAQTGMQPTKAIKVINSGRLPHDAFQEWAKLTWNLKKDER